MEIFILFFIGAVITAVAVAVQNENKKRRDRELPPPPPQIYMPPERPPVAEVPYTPPIKTREPYTPPAPIDAAFHPPESLELHKGNRYESTVSSDAFRPAKDIAPTPQKREQNAAVDLDIKHSVSEESYGKYKMAEEMIEADEAAKKREQYAVDVAAETPEADPASGVSPSPVPKPQPEKPLLLLTYAPLDAEQLENLLAKGRQAQRVARGYLLNPVSSGYHIVGGCTVAESQAANMLWYAAEETLLAKRPNAHMCINCKKYLESY